jgi:superfamily II DNA helicase RecQ
LKLNARVYTGDLNKEERDAVYQDFIKDKVSIIVATIAFGMGIDKPDVLSCYSSVNPNFFFS